MSRGSLRGDVFTWHHITRPTAADFAFLAQHFPLDEVDMATLRAGVDLPRMHDRSEWHLLALHIPQLMTTKSDLAKTSLYVLLNKTTVVTVVSHDTRLSRLFEAAKKKGAPKLAHGNTLEVAAWLLGEVFDGIDEIVDAIFARIGTLERGMHRDTDAYVTRELAALRRDVLMLDLMVEPGRSVLEQVLHTRLPYRGAAAHNRIVYLYDRLHGMHVILQHYLQLIEGMFQVHETSLSHRTNKTVQLLTIISVLLMPPTLIASYYGMNISNLPLAHDFRLVSLLIVGAVAAFMCILHLILRKR